MKPRLVKSFNEGEENYLKFEVKYTDSPIVMYAIKDLFKGLNLQNPFSRKDTDARYKNISKYKDIVGVHRYFNSDKFKIHLICSERNFHIVVKCSSEDRRVLTEQVEKHFDLF